MSLLPEHRWRLSCLRPEALRLPGTCGADWDTHCLGPSGVSESVGLGGARMSISTTFLGDANVAGWRRSPPCDLYIYILLSLFHAELPGSWPLRPGTLQDTDSKARTKAVPFPTSWDALAEGAGLAACPLPDSARHPPHPA